LEGSGSTSNTIEAKRDGETILTMVIVSRDVVEIGGWTFNRADLLFALGVVSK
jgi:ABC-type uncharacterized transport system permease subunit